MLGCSNKIVLCKGLDGVDFTALLSLLPTQVNLDYQTTQEVKENLKHPDNDAFLKAQHSIYLLMARDSFVRFVKSEPFQQALKR